MRRATRQVDVLHQKTSETSDNKMAEAKQDSKVKVLKRNMSDLSEPPSPNRVVLLEWAELPDWAQLDSNYIQTGYRPISHSYIKSLKSWRYVHNETVNIFSHLIGSVLFFVLPALLYRELQPRYQTATYADAVVISIYFFGVAICFALSTTFHTIMNHSEDVFKWGIQLDFQGILLLMWGATIPVIYYAFICDAKLQKVYWILISCTALASSIFTFSPAFRTQSSFVRPLRASLFGGFALSAIIPVVHSVAIYGWHTQNYRISLWYIFGVMAFNTTGATAYAFKFPERFFKRRFDIVGASHQIMHVAVMFAGIVHVFGLIRNFDHAHSGQMTCNA